jgi:hypothetical protein
MIHSIVAVHGLNGDAHATWTTKKTKRFWLGDRDLLPANLPNSRILTYGYNSKVASVFGKTSSNNIMQHAQTLVAELVADREVSRSRNSFQPRHLLTLPARGRNRPPYCVHLPFARRHRRQKSKSDLSCLVAFAQVDEENAASAPEGPGE